MDLLAYWLAGYAYVGYAVWRIASAKDLSPSVRAAWLWMLLGVPVTGFSAALFSGWYFAFFWTLVVPLGVAVAAISAEKSVRLHRHTGGGRMTRLLKGERGISMNPKIEP